ncbi:helix-turn-helix transcriptional regulator [Salmonella enterica]|uniref:helix-turn-helix domain-containing protein n=1 Tax=Klebsiella aerogenes TaxID=548 RepID=UPI0012D5C286|nr:helix-turn-helix transcriptional regulator [Klebsiella aerogenes]EAX8476041.1 helix-turn-helix transcriptional regulator [Salmonella enterica]ECA4080670.1 XRE family transcriptional regulator [Salmonella enterica subsp. enterica serovar Texas]EDX2434797.1 helix-turn-helix transcriptional regulator [Salmonella enterica subsp. enterica serovar Koenigstuhl]EBK0309229.1 XRE family transcriptional regulator [Salmonella enterica]EDC2508441.1 helix-turn-helix transcriptional regulator [Salmonella 
MNTSNHYNDIFCRRLKQARLASGLSQKRLGIAAGIDEFVASTRINRYEKGVHEPGTEIVQKLAEVLRVPLAYFYAEDDGLAELMLVFLSLSKQQRKDLIDYTKHFLPD